MPSSEVTPTFMGDYSAITGPFLNPQTSTTANGYNQNSLSYNDFPDANAHTPGDIGNVVYFPSLTGPFKETQTQLIASTELLNIYNIMTSFYNDYNSRKTVYEGLRDVYNTAIDTAAAQ